MKPRTLPGCMCSEILGFTCELHRGDLSAYAKEEADALGDECPWNPDDLPEYLRDFGHRMADQDGGDGSEWVTPQEDFQAQTFEAARVLLDAVEI